MNHFRSEAPLHVTLSVCLSPNFYFILDMGIFCALYAISNKWLNPAFPHKAYLTEIGGGWGVALKMKNTHMNKHIDYMT